MQISKVIDALKQQQITYGDIECITEAPEAQNVGSPEISAYAVSDEEEDYGYDKVLVLSIS